MRKQLWMIAKVWAYRPMMWLLAIVALIALLASIEDRNRTKMRSSFVIPGEFESMGSVKLTPMSTLKNGEVFQQFAQSGEVDTSVEGIDLQSMDLRDPTNPLEDFSSLEHALANYPSVRWIRFDTDQIQHVSDDTLSKLSDLETIIIHDHQVTQSDVDKIAQLRSLQMLVVETLDFPASLNTLSNSPSLNTLVLSHSTFNMVDSPMESLFRPEVLAQTHDLVHLRRLVLRPQWLPGEAYFAGRKTPDPASDPILKENAAKLLPGHPSLTDLWLGIAKYERAGKDLATVQAAMPDVSVRSAQYNETSISRIGFGLLAIVLLTSVSMSNLSGHFSMPQRRVTPNYEKPHMRFVFGFAVLVVFVSTVAIHTPVAVAWLPAIAVSVLAVAFAATLATMAIINRPNTARAWVPPIIVMVLLFLQWTLIHAQIRPVLRQAFPTMEPAMDHFLGGHQPVLAIVIAVACLPAIYWMISQFTDNDRLNAEAGLTATITGNDLAKQGGIHMLQQSEILILQRGGTAIQRALDAWHLRLEALKSKPRGWLRDVRLDWMGEPMPFAAWISFLVGATVVTFLVSRLSISGQEFGTTYFCLAVAAALIIPLVASISRRDVLPLELLCPNSRSQFMRRRTLSIATKYAYLFAGLFVHVAIVQYFCFHTLSLENIMRAVIMFAPTTIAGTGLVLWGSSIRNIFALGLLIVVGLVTLTFASFSYLDFRWIEEGTSGEGIHEFLTNPLFYAAGYAVAGLLLWTGYYRLSRCELARQ
ncbi:MAG: hypothetical protein H8E66_33455 [Planctomycetes bacterium]|nr:hypothetical protein [Planctomycetota bacterium]